MGKIEIKREELAHTARYAAVVDQKKARLILQEYEQMILFKKEHSLLKLVRMPALPLMDAPLVHSIASKIMPNQRVIKPPWQIWSLGKHASVNDLQIMVCYLAVKHIHPRANKSIRARQKCFGLTCSLSSITFCKMKKMHAWYCTVDNVNLLL